MRKAQRVGAVADMDKGAVLHCHDETRRKDHHVAGLSDGFANDRTFHAFRPGSDEVEKRSVELKIRECRPHRLGDRQEVMPGRARSIEPLMRPRLRREVELVGSRPLHCQPWLGSPKTDPR